jgi:hypothetical protein
MKFTREGQILLIIVASILAAVMFAVTGFVDIMKPHVTTLDSYAPYAEFGVAILVLIMIPVNVRRINRKFDVNEMLEDYRQRKKKRL